MKRRRNLAGTVLRCKKSLPFLTHGTNYDIHPRAHVLHEDPRAPAVEMFWNPTSVIAQLEGL